MTATTVLDEMNCASDDPPDGALALPELAARLCSGAVAISASTAAWLLLVAEFDRREGWAVPGVASCAHWLSWQCGIAPGTAREHVRLARALPGLPRVTDELGAGRLSYAKARAIARVADAGTESDLLDLAQTCTAAQLDRVVAGWRRADAVSTDLPAARPTRPAVPHAERCWPRADPTTRRTPPDARPPPRRGRCGGPRAPTPTRCRPGGSSGSSGTTRETAA